jgi:hypothetical protein
VKTEDILELLDQDDAWVTREGQVILLDELDAERRSSLLAWLRVHAPAFKAAEEADLVSYGMPSGEAAFDMVLGGIMQLIGMSPEEWIEEQPLVQRLVELSEATQ